MENEEVTMNVWQKFVAGLQETGQSISEHVGFIISFIAIIVVLILIAYCFELVAQKKNGVKEKAITTRKIAIIGMFSALATVIMIATEDLLLPLTSLFTPPFYKLDFSELPILIGSFAFGPVAGVLMEFLKIVLKLFVKGTSTAFVGELANFAVGCSFIIPASVIYNFKKTKKGAIISCIIGTFVLTVFGTAFNAVYLLPAFAKLFHMDLEMLLGMSPIVTTNNIVIFVIVCVAPLNLIKGLANSLITLLVYKPLSPIIKGNKKK